METSALVVVHIETKIPCITPKEGTGLRVIRLDGVEFLEPVGEGTPPSLFFLGWVP
jgi:hypothetical protein